MCRPPLVVGGSRARDPHGWQMETLTDLFFYLHETVPTSVGVSITNSYRHRHRVDSREAVRILAL